MKKKILIILASIFLLITSLSLIIYNSELDDNGLDGLKFVRSQEPSLQPISFYFKKDSVIVSTYRSMFNFSYKYDKKTNKGLIEEMDTEFYFQNDWISLGETIYVIDKYSSEIEEGSLRLFFFRTKYFINSIIKSSTEKIDQMSFKSFKKLIPFTEEPCKNLEGVYVGKVSTLLLVKTVTYTLTEDKTESHDGKVTMQIPEFVNNVYQIVTYTGFYRKIGEEVEIELFKNDGKTRKGLKKFRIERDQNECIKEIYDGLLLKRVGDL